MKYGKLLLAIITTLVAFSGASAQTRLYPKAKVSFSDFKSLVTDVEEHRSKRLVNFETFLRMSQEPDTIIFDSRSDFRFERIHLKGAKHLSFTDFTQANLAKIIPSFETRILIYCNNNFDGNEVDFASKVAMPRIPAGNAVAMQIESQAKPVMMALNIPTYVNLYGYGYRNVFELDELVRVKDPRVSFEGSLLESPKLEGLIQPLTEVTKGAVLQK